MNTLFQSNDINGLQKLLDKYEKIRLLAKIVSFKEVLDYYLSFIDQCIEFRVPICPLDDPSMLESGSRLMAASGFFRELIPDSPIFKQMVDIFIL